MVCWESIQAGKNPNLVCALSGHKEGSKAFARLRDIDEDIKKGLVELLK